MCDEMICASVLKTFLACSKIAGNALVVILTTIICIWGIECLCLNNGDSEFFPRICNLLTHFGLISQ